MSAFDISRLLPFLCILFCVHTCKGIGPCFNYTSFPYIDQRDVNYTLSTGDNPLNDMYLDRVWYGDEGYVVAQTPPPASEDRCGTTYPIWLQGKLPTRRREETLQACLVDVGTNCSKPFPVSVKDCGDFYVYRLEKVQVFESAYCVGLSDPNKHPSDFTVKPTVDFKLVTVNTVAQLQFTCHFTKSKDDLLYKVLWYVNGGFIHSFLPDGWSAQFENNTVLTEDILKSAGYNTPGFTLQCAVRASLNYGFPAGKGILSDGKFVGVKIPSGAIKVIEGEETEMELFLTVPFGCGPRPHCSLSIIVMSLNPPGDCDPSAFVRTACGVTIRTNSQNNGWQETKNITIKGQVTAGYLPKKTIMKLDLKTDPRMLAHPFWSNYLIGSITVQVTKRAAVTTEIYCHANQDPHMKTYDGRYYDFHDDGVYVLYKHIDFPVEVQMQLLPCVFGLPNVRCPCGIAVRAGRTVFHITKCNRVDWSIEYVQCKDGKDLIKVLKTGSKYKIYLPSGSYLDLDISPTERFFNIRLYPSNNDIGKISGMCGTFNGNCKDDMKKPSGQMSTSPNMNKPCTQAGWQDRFDDFSYSWKANHNLFDGRALQQLPLWQSDIILCTCDAKRFTGKLTDTVTCSTTAMNDKICTFNDRYRPPPSARRQCAIETKRRKRSPVREAPDREKRDGDQGTTKTWTVEEATAHCNELFNKSKALIVSQTLYGMNGIIEVNKQYCIADIVSVQSTKFAPAALESAKSLCLHEVEMNTTIEELRSPKKTVYETLFEITCMNECSGKGTCSNGICDCEDGFAGADCSVDKYAPPVVYSLVGDGHCDMADDICNETSLIGEYFDENGQIKCRFVPFTIRVDNTTTTGTPVFTTPLVESFAEAICVLPETRRKRSTISQPHAELASGFHVSIANYGQVFSEEKVLVVYNSACQECNIVANTVNCTFTAKSCTARGLCVAHGEDHPDNPCYVCDASSAIRTWLQKDDNTCAPKSTNEKRSFEMWMIGAILGGVLLAGLVVAGICFYKKYRKPYKVADTPRGSAISLPTDMTTNEK